MTAVSPGALDDLRLLDAWERTLPRARPWRELEMLAAATGEPPGQLALLPIGERDRRLLDVRASTFGPRLDCAATCPACGERLEFALDGDDLRRAGSAGDREGARAPAAIESDGWRVTFRLPDSADVAAACEPGEGSGRAAAAILDRCVVAASRDGEAVAVTAVPADVRDLVAARMADLDPGADLLVDLACPACGHVWSEAFDPAGFMLEEIDAYARRLLADVHTLARAYGWREHDVLALGAFRRRRYIELAAS
jgi:hypothetical protein